MLSITFSLVSEGWTQSSSKTVAPIITQSFAAEKGQFGHIWKIYIQAEDPDGDMFKIASVVDQPGYGHYPADFIMIKPQYRRHLKGYIQWNTYSSRTSYLKEWTQITLKVSVIDKAGNESNEVIFPFEFVSGGGSEPKPSAPFDQGEIPRLGYIHIDLFEPTSMGDGRDRDD